MSRIVVFLLSFFVISTAFSIQREAAAADKEEYDVYDDKPAHIISGSDKQAVWFHKKTDYPISFSVVARTNQQVTDSLKMCFIRDMDSLRVIMSLYYFIEHGMNTVNYDFTIMVDCTAGGDSSAVVFLVQSQKAVADIKDYKVYDESMIYYLSDSTKQNTAYTIITTDFARISIVLAEFTVGSSFTYSNGSPGIGQKKQTITSSTPLPYMLTSSQMATTFYFDGVRVNLDIEGGYNAQPCTSTTIINQNQMQSYAFPSNGQLFYLKSKSYGCQFNIIPKNLNYVAKIEMVGELTSNSQISIETDDGFGVYYAPSQDPQDISGYRGDVLPKAFYLASSGNINIQSFMGTGIFSFKVSFIEINDQRQMSTNFVTSSSQVSLKDISEKKYFLSTSKTSNAKLSVIVKPSDNSMTSISEYDYCFLNILNDRAPTSEPYERYSLRKFVNATNHIEFQSALINCVNAVNLDGTMMETLQ